MREFDLAELDRWPFAVKAACCVAAAACVLVFGYFLFLAGVRAERIGMERHQETLRDQHAERAAAAGQLATLRADRHHAAGVFSALLRRLPAQTDMPALIADISRAASTHDLAVVDIALVPEWPTAPYVAHPLAVSVTGRYHDLGAFAAAIAALPMLVTMRDFEIKPASENAAADELAMTATVTTYRYSGEAPDTAGGQHVEAADARSTPWLGALAAYRTDRNRDPFQPAREASTTGPVGGLPGPSNDRVRQPLERHPLEQLRMVGTLAANGVRHALLRVPGGNVHRVAAGDYLGTDHGRIRTVHAAGLELVEVVHDGAGGWRERPRAIVLDRNAAVEEPRSNR